MYLISGLYGSVQRGGWFLALTAISLFSFLSGMAEAEVTWVKDYGRPGINSYDGQLESTLDGGYIAFSSTRDFGEGGWDVMIIKFNFLGSIQWQKTYGTAGDERIKSLKETSDGGYIVVGGTWIMKIDKNGDIQWQRNYKINGYDVGEFTSVLQSDDGGYLVYGTATRRGFSTHDSRQDLWLLKLGSDGEVAWQKAYHNNSHDHSEAISKASDGGYLLASRSASYNYAFSKVWLVKVDLNGNIQWEKLYDSGTRDWPRSIYPIEEGGFAIAGTSQKWVRWAPWVIQVDSNGNIQWQKIYGYPHGSYGAWSPEVDPQKMHLVRSADGGYAVSLFVGNWWTYVMKIDQDGDKLWMNRIYPDFLTYRDYYGSERLHGFIAAPDGGYILSTINARNNFINFKLDSNGKDCGLIKAFDIYPTNIATFKHDQTVSSVAEVTSLTSVAAFSINDINVSEKSVCISAMPQIFVDSTTLDYGFGFVEIGAAATEAVLVANEGGTDLDLSAVTIIGPAAGQFSIASDCSMLIPGTSCIIDVTFAPTSLGEKNATLKIVSNDPSRPVIEVPLSGEGVDTKPPVVSIVTDRDLLWPPNHKLIDVLVDGAVTDDGSGIASVDITVADEYGTYDATLPGFGSAVTLKAWRDGSDKDGRVYTLTAVATDKAGNTSTANTRVLVPHDMRK